MIESFAHKQIRCGHCEFEFSITEFGSAAQIVCPACGEEIGLSSPPPTAAPPVLESVEPLPQVVPEKPVICSVEHCPLLTGEEATNPVARQIGQRLRRKNGRRQTILAWTVTLQVCVLIGAALFIAKTLLTPSKESLTLPMVVQNIPAPIKKHEDIVPSVHPAVRQPEYLSPSPAVAETRTTRNITPEVSLFTPVPPPNYTVSPHEGNHDVFPLPIADPPMTAPHVLAVSPEHTPETTPTLPQPEETRVAEVTTLEGANDLLESAKVLLAMDAERSLEQAVRAAKIYEQLGEPLPQSVYWILGNACVSLSWGETLLESSPAVETMTLSHDSRYLLAQLQDKTVWLWDLQHSENDRAGYRLDSGTAEYVKFVFTPDLRWIIGGQKNGTIRIWDISRNNSVTFTERVPGLQDLQISPNGQWLAAFGNISENVVAADNHSAQQSIQQVSYQRMNYHSASDASPYPVLVWNLRQMDIGVTPIAMPIPAVPQPVQVIRFSPNSERLAVGRKDAVVGIYDLTERGVGDSPLTLRGHQLAVTQIVFAPSGLWMATGSQDNTVRLWNLAGSTNNPESATLYGHLGWISALEVDSTGEYLVSGSYDRTIRIWNIKHNRIGSALSEALVVLETNLGIPESLALTHDGDKMIVRGNAGSLGIYHFPSLLGDEPECDYRSVTFHNSKLSISQCLLTPDDQMLIFSYEHLSNPANSGIRLWTLQPQTFLR